MKKKKKSSKSGYTKTQLKKQLKACNHIIIAGIASRQDNNKIRRACGSKPIPKKEWGEKKLKPATYVAELNGESIPKKKTNATTARPKPKHKSTRNNAKTTAATKSTKQPIATSKRKQSTPAMVKKASKTLRSQYSGHVAKSLAGSVLSTSNKKR